MYFKYLILKRATGFSAKEKKIESKCWWHEMESLIFLSWMLDTHL